MVLKCLEIIFFPIEKEKHALMKKEELERGSIVLPVYYYLMRASECFLLAFVISFGIYHALNLGKDFWLVKWSDEGDKDPNVSIHINKSNHRYHTLFMGSQLGPPIEHGVLLPQNQLRYLTNLKLFSIRVKLFEHIVLGKKNQQFIKTT